MTVEHLTERIPLGAYPVYDYLTGTRFVFLQHDGTLGTRTLEGPPGELRRYWACWNADIRQEDVPRLQREILKQLPGATHVRTFYGCGGIGIYAAEYPAEPRVPKV